MTSILKVLGAVSLVALALSAPASADDFSVLGDVDAVAMSAEDMDETQGKFINDIIAMGHFANMQTMQFAANAANQWYNDVQDYRAQTGYTGFISSGFDASTLSAANNALSNTFFSSYMPSLQFNSQVDSSVNYSWNNAFMGISDWYNPMQNQVVWGAPNSWNFSGTGFQPIAPGGHAFLGLF